MTTKDIIGIVLIAAVIVLAIDKCNNKLTQDKVQEVMDAAAGANKFADDALKQSQEFMDIAYLWKSKAEHSDSLRLIAIKSGTESRAKIRALPKEEKKRIADSSYTDVYEWALICGDSLKQTKTELEQCTIGRQAMDSAFKNQATAYNLAILRGDTLQFALVQKDKVIAIKDRQIQKERNGKRLWMAISAGIAGLLIIK